MRYTVSFFFAILLFIKKKSTYVAPENSNFMVLFLFCLKHIC